MDVSLMVSTDVEMVQGKAGLFQILSYGLWSIDLEADVQ